MRLLMLAAALLAGAPIAAQSPTPAGSMPVINPNPGAPCPSISRYEAARRGEKLGKKYLGELPGADLYKAVYRKIGGCVVPMITAYGFGATGRVRR